MKKIVMVAGGVETLEYFTLQMGQELKRLGYAVFYFDLKDAANSAKKMCKFIKPRETALITFNFEGLEKEEGIYKEGLGYVWEAYGIPCYNIAADHPYYYHDRLCDLPTGYRHISIDRKQEQYFRRFYPEFVHRGFLPLAGTELETVKENVPLGASGEEQPGDAAPEIYGANRPIDVIMTGNYTPPSFCEPYIHQINEEYAAFYQGIIDELIAKPWETVEEVALRHCEREMGENEDRDLRIALHRMIFIDLYIRNYWRGAAVRALAEAGVVVDVYGKGWEELECSRKENLRLHPQTDSLTCLQEIRRAKISLNVMPWFKDGAHDRVFNSILNGAVSISDGSGYLCEQLKEGEGVCYYNLQKLGQMTQKVKDLLQDEKEMQDIVAKGASKVLDMHTWKQRAKTVAGWIEEDMCGNSF
ncbi:MAG: glycosyltransferase [Roseburia sp.]